MFDALRPIAPKDAQEDAPSHLIAFSGRSRPLSRQIGIPPFKQSGTRILNPNFHERKKHPKKICIKNFGGTLAGGSRRGLRRPNSLCRCWVFPAEYSAQRISRGGGLRGSWGGGSKVQFWGPISLCLCAFLGLEIWLLGLRRAGPAAPSPAPKPSQEIKCIKNRALHSVVWQRHSNFGVPNTVPLVNRAFVACQKGGVLTKTAKMMNLRSNP